MFSGIVVFRGVVIENCFPVLVKPDIKTRGVVRILDSCANPLLRLSLHNCVEISQPRVVVKRGCRRIYRMNPRQSPAGFPTTSRFRSSMISKAIQIKYCFECLFPFFSFSSSLCQNFVFARLGSPSFEALLKVGNEMW